ncbi:hypothetical protein KAU45_09510 [bacterium]|nr:hypothetical protein [bacterium]
MIPGTHPALIPLLLTAVAAGAAETGDYTAVMDSADLVYRLDPAESDRWYVDFNGTENDWRITVYRTPEHLYLTLLIWEEREGGIGVGMLRWALERNFNLPLVKYALDPTGTRLHLAVDLRTPDTDPEAYLELLRTLVATAEREHALLRKHAAP